MRILLIEDETDLLETLAKGLRIKGFSIDCAEDGESGLSKAIDEQYDLIVLDLNLPRLDGFEFLTELMKEKPNSKVLILSANNELSSKLKGFNLGANDYMTKPFHFEELEVRIRMLLHREFVQKSNILRYNELRFDTFARKVTFNKTDIQFTAKELALLEYFLLNQGKLISQQELIEHVWDESVDIFSNSIRVHMSALRKKLKNVMREDPIVTKIGEGYILP
ncbi:DNA-binding response regulator [Vallitalea longa]|uniref:Stage 0 sporulation protein A homolog n=1 Tax=Vallitalea longa TaxID=2936439 RepID=A0A9W6DDL3_9FIRM|nr:response regulator transcription factor [Vallitalea longa]GKX28365.1 DNA-binding response regulator [Vallitalea longa]